MTTNHHTPIVFRSPADAETFNAPMAELDDELTSQAAAIGTANSNIGTLQGQMSTANSNIGTLQGQMSTANSNIGTLQGQMSTANSNIGTLQGQMSTAQADILALDALLASMANGIPPFGRLTLQSGKPVPDAAVSAAGTIYFSPYLGNVAQLDEVVFSFAEMQLNIASVLAGAAHDVFLCKNVVEGVVTYYIGYGPAWATVNSRGTGVGTTELVLKNGVWVNKVDMYLTCGAAETDVTAGPEEAKYLGSFLATANGQTGDNDTLGYLYNAYNQIERINSVLTVDTDHDYAGVERNWNDTTETQLDVFLGLPGFIGQEMSPNASNYAMIRGVLNDDQGSSIWSSGLTIPYGQANKTTIFGKCKGVLGKNVALVKETGLGGSDGYFIDVRHQIFTMR